MIEYVVILVLSIGCGTVAHERAHVLALDASGIPNELQWLPDRPVGGTLRMWISGRWATVSYHSIPPDTPPWHLRLAAVMPLMLTLPVVTGVGLGFIPIGTNLHVSVAVIGWLACAIPSPSDFAIFWHPQQAIATGVET